MTVLWWSVWVAAAVSLGEGWHLRNRQPDVAAGCFTIGTICAINLIVALWLTA